MEEQKKILFVINPISGGKKKTAFNSKVLEVLDLKKFKPTFQQTSRAGHAYELGKMAVEEQYDAVVAVGGDGTIKDRKSTRLNSSHVKISYAVFCLKKK